MGSHLSLAVSVTTLVTTVIYYYRMVVLTELTAEASLFNTLYAEYATPEMMDALRSVEDFAHDSAITETQIVCKQPDERLWDKKLDHDWQRLLHWYQKLVYFHRMNLLSDRFYEQFPGPIRARHFVNHVEPFAINSCQYFYEKEKNCSEVFDYLRALYEFPARRVIQCDGTSEAPDAAAADATKDEL